ncbi:MAG: minor capsid protein [Lachnospiraceae bacterium]|nr:minor capsid protein [Lachnospiraceae bacterium]MCM1240984.1 minor capsid protein [Lachnospiraceae bacterium]
MGQRERNEWIERAKQRVLDNARLEDGYARDIMELYDETANQLELEINAMWQKYAGENGLTNAEASRLLTGNEYSRWRKGIEAYVQEAQGDSRTLLELNTLAAKAQISRKEQLLSNIYRAMITLSGETEKTLTGLLGDMFKTNYYRSCYDVQSVLKVGFQVGKVDEKLLRRILEHPWSGKTYSQALWENTDRLAALARREITLGFMSGASVQKMVKEIDGVMGRGRYAAERLVRTESKYFASQGELASYREMGIEEYTYLGGGCDICAAVNGHAFRLDEAEAGVNLPPMHPNCKCTILAKVKEDLFQVRDGVNPLKDNPKFEEWKKRYVKDGGMRASVGNPADGVADHEEKKFLERIDVHDTHLVQSRLSRYTEQIAGDHKKENAVCITRDGSIFHCQGILGAVYPDFDLQDELSGAYMTHNHPASETHYSFSVNDISLFMEYKLRELVGVDDRFAYRIRRLADTSYADYAALEHAYKGEHYAAFMAEVLSGVADADMDEYDFYVRRLAEKYGFEYERQERQGGAGGI